MYTFLLRPKWVLSHVLVAALIVATVILGFWQLDRLDQRQATNDEVESRQLESALPIQELVSSDDDYDVGDRVRYRSASAAGEFIPDDEVLVLNRSLDGRPGYWVLTPLMLDGGMALVVNRGWIPFEFAPGTPRPGTEPPDGRVSVEGMLRETVTPQGIQSADPEGVLDALARPDLERYQEQLDYEILPVYLQVGRDVGGGAAVTALPRPLPAPDLSEGPHLSYAAQWFIFGTIGIIGYPLVLRRVARSGGKDGRHSDIPVDYL